MQTYLTKTEFVEQRESLEQAITNQVIYAKAADKAELKKLRQDFNRYQVTIAKEEKDFIVPEHLVDRFNNIKARLYARNEVAAAPPLSQYPEARYAGGLTFDDFNNTGKLIPINSSHHQYCYFDHNFVRDFEKLDGNAQKSFNSITQENNLKVAHKQNSQGIKLFPTKAKCALSINDEAILPTFSGELKTKSSLDRIAVITLKSTTKGPEIIVATNGVKKGWHNDNAKNLSANRLTLFGGFGGRLANDVNDNTQRVNESIQTTITLSAS